MADENLERITILLQAKDRDFARAMDRNNKLIAKLTRDAEQGTTRMSRKVQQNLDQMQASAKDFAIGFAGGVAGGIVTAAIGQLTTGLAATIRGIAQIGDEAKRSGLSAQAFQEWKFVAEQNRIGVDQLVDGFKELNLRADEMIKTGAGPAKEAFDRLGYSAIDLQRKLKDPSELMLEIVGRLEGMDKAAQIRIADEIFGGTGGERFVELLATGDEGLRKLIERAHEVGAVLDDSLIAKADEIDRKFSELMVRVSGYLKAIAVDLADFSDEGAPAWFKALSFLAEQLDVKSLNESAEAMTGLQNAIQDGESAGILDEINAAHQRFADGAVDAEVALLDLVDALDQVGASDAASKIDGIIDRLSEVSDQAAKGQLQGEALRDALTEVGGEANRALSEIESIDGVDVSGAVGAVGALLRILGAAADAAARLRANMPGPTAGPAFETVGRGGQPSVGKSQYAPTTAVRPTQRPPEFAVDMDGNGVPDAIDDVRTKGASGGKSKGGGGGKDRFGDGMKDWRVEVEGLLAEAEALNGLALSYDEYGVALDVARKKAELLQEAKEAGKEITPALRAEIDALAASYANASVELERAKQRHDEFRDAVSEAKGTLSSAFTGLITGAQSFGDALGNVIGKLAEMLAMRGFEALWTGGLGGATGGFLGMLGFSAGGYTGPGGRNQPAGVVHRGEVVFSQDDVARAGGVAAVEAMRRNGVSRAVPARASASAPQGITVTAYTDDGVIMRVAGAVAVREIKNAQPGMVRDAVAATYSSAREVPI